MGHIQLYKNEKDRCQTTGDCTELYAELRTELREQNESQQQANISAISVGAVIFLIGLAFFMAPRSLHFRKIMIFVISKLLIAVPALIVFGFASGAGIGISFGSCFKQSCSTLESNAGIIGVIVGLILAILLFIKLNRRFKYRARSLIERIKRSIWTGLGVAVIALGIISTAFIVTANNNYYDDQIESIENLLP